MKAFPPKAPRAHLQMYGDTVATSIEAQRRVAEVLLPLLGGVVLGHGASSKQSKELTHREPRHTWRVNVDLRWKNELRAG